MIETRDLDGNSVDKESGATESITDRPPAVWRSAIRKSRDQNQIWLAMRQAKENLIKQIRRELQKARTAASKRHRLSERKRTRAEAEGREFRPRANLKKMTDEERKAHKCRIWREKQARHRARKANRETT